MSIVKINSYINVDNMTEQEAIVNAITLVNGYDAVNNNKFTEDVITKLYYIVPKLGKILVVVNDNDRDTLGVVDNVLANTNISDYPLVKLPSNIIEYKELIIKKGNALTDAEILNAAQAIADESASASLPHKVPVVKVINYNTLELSKLVMPSVFGDNIFLSTDSNVITNGDVTAGNTILENVSSNIIRCAPTDSVGDYTADGYLIVDRAMLDTMISNNEDVTEVCTTKITDMSSLFINQENFNQDISKWDVSNVTNMSQMFSVARLFNQPLNDWDVSNVTNMDAMFDSANLFNQPLDKWDTSNVINMMTMFKNASAFNQDLSMWNVNLVNYHSSFDDGANAWNTVNREPVWYE